MEKNTLHSPSEYKIIQHFDLCTMSSLNMFKKNIEDITRDEPMV